MKFKKGLVAAALLMGAFATSASADNSKFLNAIYIDGGVSTMEINGETFDSMSYGLGFQGNVTENVTAGAYYGVNSPTDSTLEDFYQVGLTVGYNVFNSAELYGSVNYNFDESQTVGGVGYGVGFKYQVVDYLALTAKYNYASMDPIVGDNYDYTVGMIGVELNLRNGDRSKKW